MATKAVVPAKPQTAVVKLPDVGTLLDIFSENFQDGDIDVFELPRVKVPAGGGLAWTIPTEDGPKPAETVSGVVLHHRTWRSYWAGKFEDGNAGSPPDCSSRDGRYGTGNPGGPCNHCPLNEWGSADITDDDKKGKACKEMRAVFFLQDGDMLPTLILIPPMSIKPWKDYLMLLTAKMQVPFWKVKTKLSLTQAKNSGNITYSVCLPSFDGLLTEEDAGTVRLLKENLVPMLDTYAVVIPREELDGPEGAGA